MTSAAELIWRQGYHSTSVDQIIQGAGVCKGNFYYYFPSKEALALAVIDAWVEEYDSQLFAPAFSSNTDPLAQLEEFIDRTVASQQESNYRGCPLGRMALEMGDLNESFRSRLESAFEQWRETLVLRLMVAGIEEEEARPLARYVLASVQGAFLMTKVEARGEVLGEIAAELKSQIRVRLAAPPAEKRP